MDVDWEATLSANDLEQDHLVTPAQRTSIELSNSPSQPEDNTCTIEMDQDENECENQDKKRKVLQGSSDEDNSIIMQIGTFVNSFSPFSGSHGRKEAKEKNEPKKVKREDVQDI